jgi:hypothetical protein
MEWMPLPPRQIIGIDLAKRVFHAHGAHAEGSVAFRKKLGRSQVLPFLARQPTCVIAMEACASAHEWGRAIRDLGHEVRLIPPSYVKPYVKRQKNDTADAEAIAEAGSRPTMRFVAVKTEEQQARSMVFRTRDLLVRQRTQLINALRGHLAEHGVIAPQGPAHLKTLAAAIDAAEPAMPQLVLDVGRVYLEHVDRFELRNCRAGENPPPRSPVRGGYTPASDHAGDRPYHGHGGGSVCASNVDLQTRSRLCCLAGAGACSTFDRR